MKVDWIVSSQTEFDLARYLGPVVWINKCLRCGTEELVYQGPADVAIYQGKKFISIHRRCLNKKQGRGENMECPNIDKEISEVTS